MRSTKLAVGVLVAVGLALVVSVSAQKKTPPGKTPAYAWSASVTSADPTEAAATIVGLPASASSEPYTEDPFYYTTENATVEAGLGSCTYNNVTVTCSVFAMKFGLGPQQIGFVGFPGTVDQLNYDYTTALDPNACGFPGIDKNGGECLYEHLGASSPRFHPIDNGQPYGYAALNFRVSDLDFNTMPENQPVAASMLMYVEMQDVYGTAADCNPDTNHNVRANAHGWASPNTEHAFDVMLTRTGIDTWKVSVDTAFDNPDWIPDEDDPRFLLMHDWLYERYCEGVIGRTPKQSTKTTHQPSWSIPGLGPRVKFDIEFTRTELK
jgi:hypothetical protein